ncbi:MAG TPA: 4Fe-4S dicluster domain-containing protein [Candidatus Brocadiia bacterium]|nr:4Fe-4S dicluster domain-containing protein [Candidatus Brocadiia bacterium]
MEILALNPPGSEKDIEAINARLETLDPDAAKSVETCYQCGKCTAGCPAADQMEFPPNQIIRLVQIGQVNVALKSVGIWRCVSCETCSTRCPQKVNIAGVMNTLRLMARERGIQPADREADMFHQAFLQNVRMFGRLFEPMLVGIYNMRSMHLFHDADKGPLLLSKGKLPLFPTSSDSARVRRLFKKALESK